MKAVPGAIPGRLDLFQAVTVMGPERPRTVWEAGGRSYHSLANPESGFRGWDGRCGPPDRSRLRWPEKQRGSGTPSGQGAGPRRLKVRAVPCPNPPGRGNRRPPAAPVGCTSTERPAGAGFAVVPRFFSAGRRSAYRSDFPMGFAPLWPQAFPVSEFLFFGERHRRHHFFIATFLQLAYQNCEKSVHAARTDDQ